MKLSKLMNWFGSDGEVVARFGEAKLIRKLDGSWRLEGGSREDRRSAQEWISLFAHEAVVSAN